MSVPFVGTDDHMIHSQIVTRWAKEVPCGGIIAINDTASTNPVLRQAYISAAESQGRKGSAWALDHFEGVQREVFASSRRYFLITKNPLDMKKILADMGFVPDDVKTVVVDPGSSRPGAIRPDNNQSFTPEEGKTFEAISETGYVVKFQLLPNVEIGAWDKYRDKFDF